MFRSTSVKSGGAQLQYINLFSKHPGWVVVENQRMNSSRNKTAYVGQKGTFTIIKIVSLSMKTHYFSEHKQVHIAPELRGWWPLDWNDICYLLRATFGFGLKQPKDT